MDIVFNRISKHYAYKTVLDNVTMQFAGGKVHALLGENGAGKSTAAAILSGALSPDSGTLYIDGKSVVFRNERDAAEAGIIWIQQRPVLADSITIWENIILGNEYGRNRKKIGTKELTEKAEALRAELYPHLNFKSRTENVGGDERFYTALIAALLRNPAVLILDEPSAMLDWNQRRALYASIRTFAQTGINIIVITHSMQEAQLYTDTVTILRKGIIASYYADSHSFNPETNTAHHNRPQTVTTTQIDLKSSMYIEFSHITVRPVERPALFDTSFTAYAGTITVIQGLPESGLSTLEDVITGMESAPVKGFFMMNIDNNEKIIKMESKKYTPTFLRVTSGLNTAIVPSNRTFRASNPQLTIEQLLTALYTGKNPSAYADTIIKQADGSISKTEKAAALSGGMLQRLILARELDRNPKLIIVCEPLQGLDTEAIKKICTLFTQLATDKKIVIVLTAAGFPEQYDTLFYKLDAGKITGGYQ